MRMRVMYITLYQEKNLNFGNETYQRISVPTHKALENIKPPLESLKTFYSVLSSDLFLSIFIEHKIGHLTLF